MKQKKNETIPVVWVVVLLLLFTAVAGGLALLAKGDMLHLPEISLKTESREQNAVEITAEAVSQEEAVEEDVYIDEELHKIANTYGEMFGLLVTEGKGSLVEDKYCAAELYRVEYADGEVQVNTETKELYWFSRSNVKTEEIQLTESQMTKKAKEYLAILQLDREYGHIAKKVDRQNNIATIIFQKVIDEELELYSDYEAVKMVVSAQTGELMSCKIFTMPLVEQEGQQIGQNQAVASVQDKMSVTFQSKAECELAVCSPIAWGDTANYTSRIVWKVEADGVRYYVDAYSGSVLGTMELEV